jgi:hypothetical protein
MSILPAYACILVRMECQGHQLQASVDMGYRDGRLLESERGDHASSLSV